MQFDKAMTGLNVQHSGRQKRLQPGKEDAVGAVANPQPKHLWPGRGLKGTLGEILIFRNHHPGVGLSEIPNCGVLRLPQPGIATHAR